MTFMKDKAIEDSEALRDILSVCRDIELTVEVETRTQILSSPMELLKMVFTRLLKKEVDQLAQEKCEGCMAFLREQGITCTQADAWMGHTASFLRTLRMPCNMCLTSKSFNVIKRLCEILAVDIPAMFQEPLSVNIPVVNHVYVYICTMMDNHDYDELIDTLL